MVSALVDEGFLKEEYALLSPLAEELKKSCSLDEKIEILTSFPRVQQFFNSPGSLRSFLSGLSRECELVIKAIVAIGQGERVFAFPKGTPFPFEKMRALVDELIGVERFYGELGGIVGYHLLMIKCLGGEQKSTKDQEVSFHSPPGIDISQETKEVRRAILAGIEKMEEMAEIYPVGGAADRLNLHDQKLGIPLPAAKLAFCGKTLLERMIIDLQAREYLHYKLFGKRICTPLVMMTSQEKDNHAQILKICAEKFWFGRPQSSFRFFSQPSVPSMNRRGEWCMQGALQLLLKPGGHGVIWKLARESGTFSWLFSFGKKKALVRQINNPLAGVDFSLFAFTGFGWLENKIFGFASCPRKVGAAEGVNVLIERKTETGIEYVLTNVEYCDFQKYRLVDQAEKNHLLDSKFYSNTNILFVDLERVDQAARANPFPGVLINPKKVCYRKEDQVIEEEVARLESTMQNIADSFAYKFNEVIPSHERRGAFQTYLTYNHRKKTISSLKREFVLGAALDETPEGCFLDLAENARELLLAQCKMRFLPSKNEKALPFLFSYHPALGPLFSIIAQKIRGGAIAQGSELSLEIAEIEIVDLDLDGALSVLAEDAMGHKNENEELFYSEKTGKCVLKNVRVRNRGIDWEKSTQLWRNEIARTEECRILIHGDGEFYAENVVFEGPHFIEVGAGERVTAKTDESKLVFIKEKIQKPSWFWSYSVTDDFRIALKK